MATQPQPPRDAAQLTWAHVTPLALFMAFTLLLQLIAGSIEWKHPSAPWWRQDPAQFIYPIQTIASIGILIRYWSCYSFNWRWKWSFVGVVFGVVGIGFWLLPTTLYDHWGLAADPGGWLGRLGIAARREGFDPGIFGNPVAYWAALVMRFIRAAVVVALVEEIFWRGFLMRFVADMDGDYWKQPFGRATWLSFLVVTGMFVLSHAPVDYAGAVVYGSMTYGLCVWSKNLGACVIMHATANLLLGIYAIAYGKFGLW